MIDYKILSDGPDAMEMSFCIDNEMICIIHYGELICSLPIIRYFYSDEHEALYIDTELPKKEVRF